MPFDTCKKSVEQIDGVWPEPDDEATSVMRAVYRLRQLPIRELDPEGLRMLVAQRVSLTLILPRVFVVLDEDPLVTGDFYAGDLLVATLRAADQLGLGERERLRDVVRRLRDRRCDPVPAEVWELADDLGG
ncbi:contact-dependent growth inhibition system immunity protein [Nocardia asteroides]|uniref:contact-dependent growth inhibition system immunity protein n=1 Tax=Nocardia asteroides TaxID=1824 RepID=UPI0033DB24A8